MNLEIRPSNLYRRERCPGSAAAEATIPLADIPENPLGSRGYQLHDLIGQGLKTPARRIEILELAGDDGFILEACWSEAEALWNSLSDDQRARAQVLIEKPIPMASIGLSGEHTPDFAIAVPGLPSEDGLIILRDWKTGGGWVPSARWNLQLLTYAAAVANLYKISGNANIGLLQPIARSLPDVWLATTGELEEVLKRIVHVVEVCHREDAPTIPGGWCQFCKAAGSCTARVAVVAEIKQVVDPVSALNALEGGARTDFYERLQRAETLLAKAAEQVDLAITDGLLKVDGYEIGKGSVSRVYGMDDQEASARLQAIAINKGVDTALVVEPISVSRAEKLLGKEALEGMVMMKEGKPTVKKVKA